MNRSKQENQVAGISFKMEKESAHFNWREKFSIGAMIAISLPLGLAINAMSNFLGFSHKEISARTAFVLLALAALIGLVDYFNRVRSVKIEGSTVTSKRGIFPIPVLMWKSIDFNDIKRIIQKSRLESSGVEEGPSFFTTYHGIDVITKDDKQVRLVKGLSKEAADFLLKHLNKYRDRWINRDQK